MEINRHDIIKRIKTLFEGLSQVEISKIIGVTQAAVNNYFRRGLLPKYEAMLEIAKYANVSIEWILTGEDHKELNSIYRPYSNIIVASNPEYKEILQQRVEMEAFIPVPLISDSTAASDPLKINENDIEDFAVVYQDWIKRGHNYRCIRICDDSMHPVIGDGFIVAIDLNENDPRKLQRQIVAARCEDGVTIKYLRMNNKEYILLPHNMEKYDPITIALTSPSPIIGKVAWWWGKIK